MENSVDSFELTSNELLEFNRRVDIAHSIVPVAASLCIQKADLDQRLAGGIAATKSPWYWAIFLGALSADYAFNDGIKSFSWLSWLAIMAIVMWGVKHYEVSKLSSELAEIMRKVQDLEIDWSGAIGERTLFEIGSFVRDGYFDDDSEQYRNWWFKQTNLIVMRVCPPERGLLIVKARERSHEGFANSFENYLNEHQAPQG